MKKYYAVIDTNVLVSATMAFNKSNEEINKEISKNSDYDRSR